MIINIKNRITNIDGINKSIGRMQRFLFGKDQETDLTSLPINELDEVVYNSEKIALSCRQAIEIKEYREEDYFDEDYEKISLKDNPVSVNYDGEILRIKTPMTFKRMYRDGSLKENYMLMNYVDIALKDYVERHQSLFEGVKIPLVAIIKRTSDGFSSTKICDNDNLENGRIINKIMSALGHSDNAMVMDIYSCFRVCKTEEEIGTEFIIVPFDKFKVVFDELKMML